MDKPKTKRCISKCKKVQMTACKTKRKCSYISGSKRAYCRLSPKYKMDPNDECKPKLKDTKKNRNEAARIIQQKYKDYKMKKPESIKKKSETKKKKPRKPKSKKKTPSPGLTEKEKEDLEKLKKLDLALREKEAKKNVIANFMFKSRHKLRALYLNSICSKSGFCITLGREEKKINEFFDGFLNMKYAISPVKTIGNPSSNGFIKEIIYEREKYKSYAILKSNNPTATRPDSLYYEYLVGTIVNKFTQLFPNFVKTYGLLKYINSTNLFKSLRTKEMEIKEFQSLLEQIPKDMYDKYICSSIIENPTLSLLIEHVDQPVNIFDLINIGKKSSLYTPLDINILRYEILYIFYQLYFALEHLRNVFTHYDLHQNNVLLYELPANQYITMHYHSDIEITFQTRYIPKIIDYGRCYFFENDTKNSKYFHDEILCKLKECKPKCGQRFGHDYYGKNNAFINKLTNNISHDLRFAYLCMLELNQNWSTHTKEKISPQVYKLINKVVYGVGTKGMNYRYGTRENKTEGYNNKSKINNLIQMKKALDMDLSGSSNDFYSDNGYISVGDLHIYNNDKEMNFIPAKI